MPRRSVRVLAFMLLDLALIWAVLAFGPTWALYRVTPACTLELRTWARIYAVVLAVEPRAPPSVFEDPRAVACQRQKGGTGRSPFAPIAIMTDFREAPR